LPKGTEENGNWWGKEVQIDQEAHIVAPSVVGNNCVLETGVTIGPLSTIGAAVTVGAGTMIKRSVVWDNVSIGKDCHVKSAVICHDVELGDAVILEEGAVVGAGTTIPAGTRVTQNARVTRDEPLD